MKRTILTLLSLLLTITCILGCLTLISCNKGDDTQTPPAGQAVTDPLWENATYTADKEFGNGSKTVQVEVKAGDSSITFTIKTDKTTLADAMLEHELIAGDEGPYGLYVKTVNGILADWDVDQTYWAVEINGKTASSGASDIEIIDGEHYEFTRKK